MSGRARGRRRRTHRRRHASTWHLEVAAGARRSRVLGPNGAGKTTLLARAVRAPAARRGSVRLGTAVLDDPATGVHVAPEERGDRRGVPGPAPVRRTSTRVDNVAFGLQARGVRRRAPARTRDRWLERLGRQPAGRRPRPGAALGRARRSGWPWPGPSRRARRAPAARRAAGRARRGGAGHRAPRAPRPPAGPRRTVPRRHPRPGRRGGARRRGRGARGRARHRQRDDRATWSPGPGRPGRPSWPARTSSRGTASGVDLALEAGGVLVAAEAPGDGPVLVAVPPVAVALHVRRPGGSPRNRWPAAVEGLEPLGRACGSAWPDRSRWWPS